MLVTGSQLDRVARCLASAALPQIIDASDEDNDSRDRGTAIHRFLERVGDIGREAALAEVDDQWRGICSDLDLGKLATQISLSHEVAIAYNWRADTARLLHPVAPRAYEIDPSCEIATTMDVVGLGQDAVHVGDYKGPRAWLPAPEQSYQLGLGAVATTRLFDKSHAIVEYIRIRDDGSVRTFRGELDVFDLEAAAARIADLMRGVPDLRIHIEAGLTPDVTEGPWCRYCPAKQHCPAKTALVRRVLTDPAPVSYLEPLTPETALRYYRLLAPARAALAHAEAALYAYAKTTPIPLGDEPDGSTRWFGELRREGNEVLDGAVSHRVLAELYGGEAANSAVTMEVTKKAITDVVRDKLAPGQKITIEAERVFERIRQLGGASRPITTSTTEYTVSADGDAKARRRKGVR
jgi:hypothetical protein